jgi:predicted DNA-binding antitoxin AbrB/MazE fold protein
MRNFMAAAFLLQVSPQPRIECTPDAFLVFGDCAMALTIEAVYENGVLKPKKPLSLAEGTAVRVAVSPLTDHDPLASVVGIGESGRTDGADNHDRYIYGTRRRE